MKQIRRIGLIGDVHGEDIALQQALAFLRGQQNLDAILCTGDLPGKSGSGDMARCIELLQEAHAVTIRGNHDRWIVKDTAAYCSMFAEVDLDDASRLFLAALPVTQEFGVTQEFEAHNGTLLLCHGLGTDDMSGVYPSDGTRLLEANMRLYRLISEKQYRYIVNGHTHQHMVRHFDGLTIINAGTLIEHEQPGVSILDFNTQTVEFYNILAAGVTLHRTVSISDK